MPLAALCNLGCSKNQVDGSQMIEHLHLAGYTLTDNFEQAEVILVNTCAFIQEAKMEAIDKILEMAKFKKNGHCTTLVVCGCFSQRFRETVRHEFPEVDVWAGVHDWPKQFAEHLKATAQPQFVRTLSQPLATQYLKISEGCSHRCTFCAIPGIRGNFKSRAEADIIAEAQWLEQSGVRECILVSQDTSYYGTDRNSTLTRLLEKLLKHTSFPWIRTMYLHPSRVDDALLRLVAQEPRLCPYFDIPLQHAADPILKAMHRTPLAQGTLNLIERIRTIVPNSALRTTFIVGFPGETEVMFLQLVRFVETMRFEKVGVFPFSPEEDTPACTMRPRPRNSTAARRCDELMAVQRDISKSIGQSRVGSTVDVIIDEVVDTVPAFCQGRTQWDAPEIDGTVFIKQGMAPAGSIVPVTIVSADEYDMYGMLTR